MGDFCILGVFFYPSRMDVVGKIFAQITFLEPPPVTKETTASTNAYGHWDGLNLQAAVNIYGIFVC